MMMFETPSHIKGLVNVCVFQPVEAGGGNAVEENTVVIPVTQPVDKSLVASFFILMRLKVEVLQLYYLKKKE